MGELERGKVRLGLLMYYFSFFPSLLLFSIIPVRLFMGLVLTSGISNRITKGREGQEGREKERGDRRIENKWRDFVIV